MSTYSPDNWVVLWIKENESSKGYAKVLAGWYGGYLDGASWRLNSGVTGVKEHKHYFEFFGNSGSAYRCSKGTYRLSMSTGAIWEHIKKSQKFDGQLTLMPEDTDWNSVDW